MAKKNKSVKVNRKKNGGRSPLVSLLIIVVLIILAFYLLEKLRKPAPEKPVAPPPTVAEKKPPVKVARPPAVHKRYSTAAKVPPPPVVHKKPPVIPPPQKPVTPVGRGTVAIIIDDMGSSLHELEVLTAINAPLTFSIIPGLAKSREVAEAAHDKDYEVMVHMPMEPQDYPKRRLEKNGLLLSESDEEIESQVKEYLRTIPHVVGANNHMGSRFTEDTGKMRDVLQVLKGKGLYFVDSMTTPRSVGRKLAGEMGMRTAARNVFLDNSQDVAAIRKQIRELAGLAAKRGSAIGICHPHKATILALAAELPLLQKEGITFVYASKLVR